MSADNYNMIIQLPNGKWIMSPNHSMRELMQEEERDAYIRAVKYAQRSYREAVEYASEAEAYAAADKVDSEHGTFSHEYREWFDA